MGILLVVHSGKTLIAACACRCLFALPGLGGGPQSSTTIGPHDAAFFFHICRGAWWRADAQSGRRRARLKTNPMRDSRWASSHPAVLLCLSSGCINPGPEATPASRSSSRILTSRQLAHLDERLRSSGVASAKENPDRWPPASPPWSGLRNQLDFRGCSVSVAYGFPGIICCLAQQGLQLESRNAITHFKRRITCCVNA